MEEKNWDYLLESLEEGRCIICLGPGTYTAENGAVDFERQLAKFLRHHEEQIGIRVYDDGWFHYLPDASEIDAWQKVREFYTGCDIKTREILKKISQIPGHLFLNFTPDYHLRSTFDEQNFVHDFISYEKNIPYDPHLKVNQHLPTSNRPLLLNLMGETRKRNSLVMTYNDFYDYLSSVFKGKSLSPGLRKNIYEAEYFIFLGMPFDKWYVHLFMRILQQHENGKKSKKYAANIALSEVASTHSAEQYTMTFVNNGITEFVDELYERCASQQKLRSAAISAQYELPYKQLQTWLMHNDFASLFRELLSRLEKLGTLGADWKLEVMQIQGRYNRVQKEKRNGTMGQENIDLETNRVRMGVLELLEEIRQKLS